MKKVLRSPATWIIIGIIITIVCLYIFGFRITYSPNLENDWDAISGCATWFSGIMSAIAIFVAIRIPKRIAEKQDKIALFDKRFHTFNTLSFLLSIIKNIAEGLVSQNRDRKEYFESTLKTYKKISLSKVIDTNDINGFDMYASLFIEVGNVEHLFNSKDMDTLMQFLKNEFIYIAQIYLDLEYDKQELDEQELIASYNELINKGIYNALSEQLKIY